MTIRSFFIGKLPIVLLIMAIIWLIAVSITLLIALRYEKSVFGTDGDMFINYQQKMEYLKAVRLEAVNITKTFGTIFGAIEVLVFILILLL